MINISNGIAGGKKAIVAGHFCLDILPDLSNMPSGEFFNLFIPGHLLETGKMNIATGGAASNTGISMTKLGVPTSIIARIGNDGFGQIAATHLEKFVLSEFNQLNLVDNETTSYTIIVNPPSVDRIFLHHPGANDAFTEDDVNFSAFPDHVLFHYGYPQLMKSMFLDQGKRLITLFRNAKEAGFTTSLDTSFPDPSSEMGKADWKYILKETLPYVDIFCPSFEEAYFMLDRIGYESYVEVKQEHDLDCIYVQLIEEILELGTKVILLKLGEQGAIVQVSEKLTKANFGKAWFSGIEEWQNRVLWAPSYKVDVVGTTGAGDATIAGFLGAILNEMPIEEALSFSMGVGACNVEAIDSVSGVRTWGETATRINDGWLTNPISLDLSRWIWIEKHQIWQRK